MGVARVNLWSFLFICLSIFSISTSDGADCEYAILVQTGTVSFAGTDSTISLSMYDAYGSHITINNLVGWGGKMDPDHDYFEKGNLDIYSGETHCLSGPICALKVTSEGSGLASGWYCSYVEVSRTCGSWDVNTTGVLKACSGKIFTINQWVETDVVLRDYCPSNNKKNLNVKGSDLNVEGSSDNKKYLNVEGSDLNVEGSESSNVPGV